MKFSKNFVNGIFKNNRKLFFTGIAAFSIFFCLLFLLSQCEDVLSIDYLSFFILGYLLFFYLISGRKMKKLNTIIFWIMPVLNFFLLESFLHNPFLHVQLRTMALNLVFYYIFFLFVLFVSGNKGITVMVSSTIAYGIGLANYALIIFRQNPILPWDLLSIGTAAKVADSYTLPISTQLITISGWFLLIFLIGIVLFDRKKSYLKITRIRALFALSGALILSIIFAQSPSLGNYFRISDSLFQPADYFKYNGYVLGFVRSMQYVDVNEPSGYSRESAISILEEHKSESNTNSSDMPNVIVIMNEAFSDLSVLGDFSTNIEYMPYFKSLSEDSVHGNLHVSVKGGNTANSEFEFLTGNSMAFLPSGSVPYELYIKEQTPTIASYLRDSFSYDTYAVHPYYETAWRRNNVYPLFGFNHLLFDDDFSEDIEVIRKFASDSATYDKIIELYENRNPDNGFFTFCVTLQNHGGYDVLYDNFSPDVFVEGLEDEVALNQYLSLIKESDQAFQEFVEYFKGVDEDTIILMFGDHQPTDDAIKGLLQQVNFNNDDLQNFEKQYVTPFIIWANYDIQEQYIENISCNYLSSILLETAGIPLDPYLGFLGEVRKEIPVVTANCAIDQSGSYIGPENFSNIDALSQYNQLQYFKMFDS